MKGFPAITEAQLHKDAVRRRLLDAQVVALANRETPPSSPPVPARVRDTAPLLLTREDMLKGLGLHRKSVKAKPVLTHYQPQHITAPLMFKWKPSQRLSKLSRPVGAGWVQALTSISTTYLAGGRLLSAQGRNLITIVQELRKHCYLRVSKTGRPVQVREQVVLKVDGGGHCFARACGGMSVATFYRALRHPLAHIFIRTQKVQREVKEAQQDTTRRNVGTLFTVSLYEPDLPAELEDAYYAAEVEESGIFLVPDSPSQDDRTKERPLKTLKQRVNVDNLTAHMGLSSPVASQNVQQWLDAAPLGTQEAAGLDTHGEGLEGCIDKLRLARPDLWELATQIAIHHDVSATQAVAAVGYYKALIHVGFKAVRRCVQAVERYQAQGQNITNPGAVLMAHLNREARGATGYNIRDLGTEKGTVLA